jgi:Nitrate and nitrite sensing
MPGPLPPDSPRAPLLARLKVGTKLMLLVLLPVCVLLAFTTVTVVADWQAASELRNFQAATRLSFATARLADRLADERAAALLLRIGQAGPDGAQLAVAQRAVDQALHEAAAEAAGWDGAGDLTARLGAAGRRLGNLRLQAAAGSLPAQRIPDLYGMIVGSLISDAGSLVAGRPTQASGRAADAYVAILQAVDGSPRRCGGVRRNLGAAAGRPERHHSRLRRGARPAPPGRA